MQTNIKKIQWINDTGDKNKLYGTLKDNILFIITLGMRDKHDLSSTSQGKIMPTTYWGNYKTIAEAKTQAQVLFEKELLSYFE